jgi:hypothetical protein
MSILYLKKEKKCQIVNHLIERFKNYSFPQTYHVLSVANLLLVIK